ncbi:HIRAN domain-containing protein [Natronospora cellulosivora (SeqCode)]
MVIAKYDNELLVVWKEPVSRNRIVIGRLWKDDENYYFEYIRDGEDERGSIDFAMRMGYKPIKIFDDISKKYISKTLFAPFLNRLNGKDRENNPFEVLKRTGGKLNTDTLEFMLPIDEVKERREVNFKIAGWRYYDGDKVVKGLRSGQNLFLDIEEENIYDMHAIEIWTNDKQYKLGYVPAIYSRYIDKLVKEGKYQAVIEAVNSNDDPYNIVCVRFSGKMVKPKVDKKKITIV